MDILDCVKIGLHLFSFKMPTLWAFMSREGVAYCASSMQNGVKTMYLILIFYHHTKMLSYNRPGATNKNIST